MTARSRTSIGATGRIECHADRERRVPPRCVLPLDHAVAVDLARVPHPDSLHDGPGAHVVADRARHDGARLEHTEGMAQAGAADLRREASTPVLAAERPADLEP